MKTNKKRKNKQFRPYKEDIFNLFEIWSSIPQNLKNTRFFKVSNIDNENLKILLSIKNKTEFCNFFDINKSTIQEWQKHVNKIDLLEGIKRDFQIKMREVYATMYLEVLNDGDPKKAKMLEDFCFN